MAPPARARQHVWANPQTIDHTTLTKLVEAGAVRAASVVGQSAGWGVLVRYGRIDCPLAARRGGGRKIRKLDTVMDYLKALGISRFDVDAANFDAQAIKTTRTRPDSSTTMSRVHEAAAHDAWFREQVKLGVSALDAGQILSEAQHAAHRAKRRAALTKRANPKT